VQRSASSGLDNCDLGSMCWYLDGLDGVCVSQCSGSLEAPMCPDHTHCVQSSDATITLCLPNCDPLAQDCVRGTCLPWNDFFECGPSTAPPGTVHGDPCESLNACPPGLVCVEASAHTSCASAIGCCSTACDLTVPDPCPSLDPNQICEPWFRPGMAPAGYEHVGVCGIPR
jgi:hypothetical protein